MPPPRAPRPSRTPLACALTLCLAAATSATAGMPSLTLTDVARARVQTISFFLLLFFAGALGIKLLWNALRGDFSRLPRLTYPKALALTALWGLLFLLVLTMISGARELMTPAAWEKNGPTYKLKPNEELDHLNAQRLTRLAELKAALWEYAHKHEGHLPPDDHSADIPSLAWTTPEPSRIRYHYVPGRKADTARDVVAYEPNVFPTPRLALLSDGTIQKMTESQLKAALGSDLR